MKNTIKAQVWLIEDGKKHLWAENFRIVDELPYKDMTELIPLHYDVPDGDCNAYRFFMNDVITVAIPAGELETFEEGEIDARNEWNEVFSNHDEDDFKRFAAPAGMPGLNDDVIHSSAYCRGYKSEVLKIAKENGYGNN